MAVDLMHGTVPALVAGIVVIMISAVLAGRRSRHERAAGVHALKRMSYEELRPLLLMMLKRRGFELPPGAHHTDRSHPDFVVLRGRSRYLVHTRFEPNDTVDAATVDRFATMIAAQNADGGFLIATCPVVVTASSSPNTRLEVIGAEAFWRELRPILPDDLANEVRIEAGKHRRRRLQLAALAGIACAAAVYGLTTMPEQTDEVPVAGTAVEPAAEPAPPAAVASAPEESAAPASTTAAPTVPPPGTAAVAEISQAQPVAPAAEPPAPAPPAPAASADAPASAPAAPATDSAPAAASAPASVPAPAPAPAAPASAPPAGALAEIEALTEPQRAERRAAAAEAVRATANVASAEWSTKSTLVVRVPNAEPEVRKATADAVCPVLLRWEELRYTRLQVEDVTDGSKVSWRSCQ